MPVIKIKVRKEMASMPDQMKRLLDDFFYVRLPLVAASRGQGWRPPVDVYEDEGAFYVVAELAGIDRENLMVTSEGSLLHISGHRPLPFKDRPKRYFHMEIEYGPFSRAVQLPAPVDPEGIEAKYGNGLLVVHVPKKEQGEPVRIEVS